MSIKRSRKRIPPKPRVNKNHQIQADTLRVISEDGSLIGIMSKAEALRIAEEQKKDLVEISAQANPVVAKLIEFGKFKYQQEKKERASRKTSHVSSVKQIRLSLKIGQGELDTKLKKAKEFLEKGDKVRISMMLKGRENAHPELGVLRMQEINDTINVWAKAEQEPRLTGRTISAVYKLNTDKPVKDNTKDLIKDDAEVKNT